MNSSAAAAIGKLVRGGSWAFVGKLTTYPLGLILTMLIARLLTPADVGGYFLIMSLVMISSGLVQAGLATTISKFIAKSAAADNPRGIRSVINTGIVALVLTGVLASLILLGDPGSWIFEQLDDGAHLYGSIAWIASIVIAIAMVGYCCEILRGFNALPSAALLDQQLMQRLLLVIALLIPLAQGLSLELSDVLRLTVFSALIAAGLGIVMISRLVKPLGLHGAPIPTRELLRQAPTFLLVRINNWLLNSAAIWFLGFARPLEETALYGAANVIALLVLASWQVVSAATGPTVTMLHEVGHKQELQTVVRSAASIAAIPAILLSTLLFVFGTSVLSVLFTDDYSAAYAVLVVLATGRAMSTLFGSPVTLLSMTRYQGDVLRVLLVASGLTIVGYWLVVEHYGGVGVAVVSALSAIFQGITMAVLARRRLSINTLPLVSAAAWGNLWSVISKKKQ